MMQWLTKNNPPPVMERRVVEPGATFSLFENHWKQATEVMESSQDADGALTVISHLSQMISFLRVSKIELSGETSCKRFWLSNRCSDKVIKWLHILQLNGLRLPSDYELKLVEVLYSLCEVASEILGFENEQIDNQDWDWAYSLASLLLEYSLRSDPQLGDRARYSFILLIQLASRFPGLEKSLTQESGMGLTNVVISGLSACFSQLPTFTNSTAEQLQAFIVQLKFVEEITEVASDSVASTIAECFHNAFLLGVIEPALTQDEGSYSLHSEHDPYLTSLHEEIAVVTKYLQIVCEQLKHSFLNRSIIQFITTKLLSTLVHRLNHMSVSITTATLRLFTVLLEFYCEDFWYEIILRHLLSQNHLMVSQRYRRLSDIDFHDSSVRFLSLIPMTVIDALSPETLTSHYVQYLNSESERLANIDSAVSLISSTPPQQIQSAQHLSDENEGTSGNESTNRNVIYPFWKFKYDGSDVLDKDDARKRMGLESREVKESETIKTECEPKVNKSIKPSDPLMNCSPELEFTTINLLQSGCEDLKATTKINVPSDGEYRKEMGGFSVATSTSEGYASMDSFNSPTSEGSQSTTQIASFGPFLDSILVQLSCWENQNPDVSLVLSELVSVLASSRIPLINTIILDPNLTLQPSYVTFMSLLKRIRDDLDFRMKSVCSKQVIIEVWLGMNSGANAPKQMKDASTSRMTPVNPTSNLTMSPFGDNLGESIRKRISGGGTGIALVSAFNSVFGRKSSSPVATLVPRRSESVNSFNPSGYRYVNNQAEQAEVARILATRAIIFSHWLLELGAIAQQLCWKQK